MNVSFLPQDMTETIKISGKKQTQRNLYICKTHPKEYMDGLMSEY